MYDERTIARFWSFVDRTGDCWEWQRGRNAYNYGVFHPAKGVLLLSHRLSWELANGPIPTGLSILHRCDNPPCVNPAHLWAGTKKENTQDMVAKGRARGQSRYGTDNFQAVLTPDLVRDIRRRFAAGEKKLRIAGSMGVSRYAVRCVLDGSTWSHVSD